MIVRQLSAGASSPIKYNLEKVIAGKASIKILHMADNGTSDYPEAEYGSLVYDPVEADIMRYEQQREESCSAPNICDLLETLREYEKANYRTRNPWFHMAVNPGMEDNMSEEQTMAFVRDLMTELGFGNQPYVVFKHEDISRIHYHVISIRVNKNGRKIHPMCRGHDGVLKPYKLEKRRCLQALKTLQQKYDYKIGTEKTLEQMPKRFDAQQGNIHQQILKIIKEELENPHVESLSSLERSVWLRGVDISYRPTPNGGYFVCKGLEQDGKRANIHSVIIKQEESKEIYDYLYEVNRKQRIFGLINVVHALDQSQSLSELKQRIGIEILDSGVVVTKVCGAKYNFKPDDLLDGLGNLLRSKTEKDFVIRKKILINRSINLRNVTRPFADYPNLPEDYKTLKAQDICEKINSKLINFPEFKAPVQVALLKIEHLPEKEEEWNGPGEMTILIEDSAGLSRTFGTDSMGRITMEQPPGYNRLYDVNKGIVVTENIPVKCSNRSHKNSR